MAIYAWTGNPFVDAGILIILQKSGKKELSEVNFNDLQSMADLLIQVYKTKPWQKNLFSVFPNSKMTNPSIKDKQKAMAEYFNEIIDNITPFKESGNCVACGRRDSRRGANRSNLPMSGYEGSHFFSFKAEGADLCDACTFAVQCMPLNLFACGKMALVHSNSFKVMKYWTCTCLEKLNRQIAINDFTGCFNENYTNATNALFHIAQDLILQYEEQWKDENASIRIYHFTNFGQGPGLDIYDLPAPIFRFLASIRLHPKYTDWKQIIRKGFGKQAIEKNEEEIKNYRNDVYNRLLYGQSIIKYFIEFNDRKVIGDWSLLEIYLKEVLSMDENRIQIVKRVADEIVEMIKTSSNGKKRLVQLEIAKNYNSCRMVLLRLIQDRVAAKMENPLFTYDEYVEHLFPDGALGWNETRDLLLFRIYEKLHDWLIAEGIVPEESDEEIE
jgi:CRISPR-associated protein Cst1